MRVTTRTFHDTGLLVFHRFTKCSSWSVPDNGPWETSPPPSALRGPLRQAEAAATDRDAALRDADPGSGRAGQDGGRSNFAGDDAWVALAGRGLIDGPGQHVEVGMVSVIICTYNRASILATVLEDLRLQVVDGTDWEVLVIDNNSSDHTRQIVEAFIPRSPVPTRYILESRQGKSFALNTGIAASAGDVLAFTDDDVRVDQNWVTAIATAFAQTQCDLAVGRIRPIWPGARPAWYVTSGPYSIMAIAGGFDLGEQIIPTNRPPFGANMAVRRTMIEQHGGFRADLGPQGTAAGLGEDTEFGERLIRAGARCVYLPAAIVDHLVEARHCTKRYVQQWYFHFGRSAIQKKGRPAGRLVFGVPPYLLRDALRCVVNGLFSLDPEKRLLYRFRCFMVWGSIVQSLRMAR